MEPPTDEQPLAFGQLVAKIRGAKRLSASETARRAGISRQHLYRIENGIVTSPGRNVILQLGAALGLDRAELLCRGRLSAKEKLLQVIWEHSSELTAEDWHLLEQIESRLIRSLRIARRI